MSGLLVAMLIAALALSLMSWGLVSLLSPRLPWGRALSFGQRLFFARALLYMPLWLPLLLIVSALLPGFFPSLDHCLTMLHHHHHLCFAHPPHAPEQGAIWLGFLMSVGAVGWRVSRAARKLFDERRLINTILATSEPSALGDDVRLLAQPEPLAFAAAWASPKVLISQGLLARAKRQTIEVILAHERAHIAHHDTLHGSLDLLIAACFSARTSTTLLNNIALAREQRCDHHAALTVGGALPVAQALVEVMRLRLEPAPVGASMASAKMEARVSALLSPIEDKPQPYLLFAAALFALIASGFGPLHHFMEGLLSTFLR